MNETDIATMSDDNLIDWISALEKDVEALSAVRAQSEKIKKKIADINDAIGGIVKVLDERK